MKTSWAPDQVGTHHALEDPYAVKKRSLCGLRVDIDSRFVLHDKTADALLHISTVGRICRSCLEKLGTTASGTADGRHSTDDAGTERHG